jgi:hypothetical protein
MLRRLKRIRCAAALLAALIALGPLLSAAHLALVQHVTCDHGETIEIVFADGEQHQHAGTCIRESSAASEHEHDHCAVAGHQHARAVAPDRSVEGAARVRQLVALPDATAPPQIALLSQAPKSSPPA